MKDRLRGIHRNHRMTAACSSPIPVCARSRWALLTCPLWLASALAIAAEVGAPVVGIGSVSEGAGPVLAISSSPQQHVRLDAADRLGAWEPLALLFNTNGLAAFIDPDGWARPMRFYRAAVVERGLAIVGWSPQSGRPGSQFDLFGQFFAGGVPGDNVVYVGGVAARVIEASATRLRVEVPVGATTGPITVTSPEGSRVSPSQFIVKTDVAVRFNPPAGIDPAGFVLANCYGSAVASTGGGDPRLTVRQGMPLLNLALPRDGAGPVLFLALSLSGEETIVCDADSTAQALVFLHPAFRSTDPVSAAQVWAKIQADPKVQALGPLYAALAGAGTDPLSDTAFTKAYAEAVLSVDASLVEGPVARPNRHVGLLGAPGSLQFDSTDLSFVSLRADHAVPVLESASVNPLDWVVRVRRLDVDKEFPLGRHDYADALRGLGRYPKGRLTPFEGTGPATTFVVDAELWTDYYNLSGLVVEAAKKTLFGLLGQEEETGRLENLEPNALYLVRAISPAFLPKAEWDFVASEYPNEQGRAVAINAVHLALDLLGILIDTELAPDAADHLRTVVSAMLETVKAAGPIESKTQFLKLAEDLAQELEKELLTGAAEDLAGKGFAKIGGFIARTADLTSKVSSGLNAAERVLNALLFASPLETAFIEVGDPFQLEVVRVQPLTGSVGDPVDIVIRGQYFDPKRESDFVSFAGGAAIADRATVIPVNQGDGTQKITARVPASILDLPESARDNPALIIEASGRRGTVDFQFLARPTVTAMEPAEGFASTPNYLGAPFPGTAVRLRGYGFGPGEKFFFGGREATDKAGVQGDVTIRVPEQALSGPIRIVRHPDTPRVQVGYSPDFSVLGVPVITHKEPLEGPVGTTVRVGSPNLGPGPAMLLLNGAPLAELLLLRGEIGGIVPSNATSGAVTLVTPGGTSASFEFKVAEGLARGGIIEVGGDSVVTLERALQFIAGAGTPPWRTGCSLGDADCVDDEDYERDEFGNPIRLLDPPFEEGDFMTDNGVFVTPRFPFGALFADLVEISNTVYGNFVLSTNSSFDVITGAPDLQGRIDGSLVVAGNNNRILHLTIRGQLVVSGNDNEIQAVVANSENDGVVITGNGNHVTVQCISNTYSGLVIRNGKGNQVTVWAAGNTVNGVTVVGTDGDAARGNRVSVTTGLRDPRTGRGLARSGNGGHGVALLGNASENVITGVDVIAGNGGDALYLSGPGVTHNRLTILDATANEGNGFSVSGHAADNLFNTVLAEGNGGSGLLIDSATGTVVQGLRTGSHKDFGVRITGVADLGTSVQFESRLNQKAGLRLDGVTAEVACQGSSFMDAVGLQIDGVTASGNAVTMKIARALNDGATIIGARRNRLRLEVTDCGGNGVTLAGGAVENDLRDLRSNHNSGHGLLLTDLGTRDNQIPNAVIGVPVAGEPAGNQLDGIRLEQGATANRLGNPAGEGCTIQDNGGVGIRLVGPGTLANTIDNAQVAETPAGLAQSSGIVLEAGAVGNLLSNNRIIDHPDAGIVVDNTGAFDLGPTQPRMLPNQILRNQVGIRLTGAATRQCRVFQHELSGNAVGLALENLASANTIGPSNFISGGVTGVRVQGASTNRIEQNLIEKQTGAGISFSGGAADNRIFANRITHNQTGIEVSGQTTLRNRITENSITANLGKGIRLLNGGNREQPAPDITSVGSQRVTGSVAAPPQSAVELFHDPADEGEVFLNTGGVRQEEFQIRVALRPGLVGPLFRLHATVTDPDGNTSEFGGTEAAGGTSPIAFTSTRDGNAELYLTDGFGATATRLTGHSAEDSRPAFSPDRMQLAFVSRRDGNAEIYRLALGGTNELTRLTTHDAADLDPAWSPDGTKIAFVSERDGNAELYTMNADGSGVTRISFDPAADRSPSWSPDGKRLAFASLRGGTWGVWLMNTDGTAPQLVMAETSGNPQPAWSPDGTRIAFVSGRDGNAEIYAIDVNGTHLERWTDHPAADVNPAWLPDGRTLLFASDRDAGFELYLVRDPEASPERLTVSQGDNTEPAAAR